MCHPAISPYVLEQSSWLLGRAPSSWSLGPPDRLPGATSRYGSWGGLQPHTSDLTWPSTPFDYGKSQSHCRQIFKWAGLESTPRPFWNKTGSSAPRIYQEKKGSTSASSCVLLSAAFAFSLPVSQTTPNLFAALRSRLFPSRI